MTSLEALNVSELVRAYFAAYETKDRHALESLLADDFTFSSPRDDHIDTSAYFERCWPFSADVRAFHLDKVFLEGSEAFVQYECEPKLGAPFHNVEHFRTNGDKIAEIVVYFGASTDTNAEDQRAEREIREHVARMVNAVHHKDVDARTGHNALGIVAFDVVNPLRRVGAPALRKRAEEWFGSYRGAIDWDVRDLVVAAGGDVAFCHSLARIRGTTTDDQSVDMWIRSTLGFRKIDGTWTVVHDHGSVPFDPATGKASLDLQP